MKAPFLVATLTAMLIALPSIAQQGPAGVPGAPGLAPPPPPPAVVAAPPAPPLAPSESKPVHKCGKTKAGKSAKHCPVKKNPPPANCGNSSDPLRCEQHRKTREACKNLPERDYRQCLRDHLGAPK